MFLMFSYTFSEIFFFTFFEFYVIELMLYLRVQVNWYKLQLFQNFICGQVLHKYLSWLEIFEMVMTLQDKLMAFEFKLIKCVEAFSSGHEVQIVLSC